MKLEYAVDSDLACILVFLYVNFFTKPSDTLIFQEIQTLALRDSLLSQKATCCF